MSWIVDYTGGRQTMRQVRHGRQATYRATIVVSNSVSVDADCILTRNGRHFATLATGNPLTIVPLGQLDGAVLLVGSGAPWLGLHRSTDMGRTWTQVDARAGGGTFVHHNGYVYSVGDSVFRSDDGVTWTLVKSSSGMSAGDAVSFGDYIYVPHATSAEKLFRSADGVTWVEVTSSTTSNPITAVFVHATYLYYVTISYIEYAGATCTVARSSNGTAWADVATLDDEDAMRCGVSFGGGIYLGGANFTAPSSFWDNVVLESTDGTNFTRIHSVNGAGIHQLVGCRNRLYADADMRGDATYTMSYTGNGRVWGRCTGATFDLPHPAFVIME